MINTVESKHAETPRSDWQWAVRYERSPLDEFEHWSAGPVLAASSGGALNENLEGPADPGSVWSDPTVVERLARVAAHVEAFSMLRPTPVVEALAVEAALAPKSSAARELG